MVSRPRRAHSQECGVLRAPAWKDQAREKRNAVGELAGSPLAASPHQVFALTWQPLQLLDNGAFFPFATSVL